MIQRRLDGGTKRALLARSLAGRSAKGYSHSGLACIPHTPALWYAAKCGRAKSPRPGRPPPHWPLARVPVGPFRSTSRERTRYQGAHRCARRIIDRGGRDHDPRPDGQHSTMDCPTSRAIRPTTPWSPALVPAGSCSTPEDESIASSRCAEAMQQFCRPRVYTLGVLNAGVQKDGLPTPHRRCRAARHDRSHGRNHRWGALSRSDGRPAHAPHR